MYANEVYNRSKLGIQNYDNSAVESLKSATRLRKTIIGTPSYDLLDNRFYQTMFGYQPIHIRNEPIDFEVSNAVTKALYLADHYAMNG